MFSICNIITLDQWLIIASISMGLTSTNRIKLQC